MREGPEERQSGYKMGGSEGSQRHTAGRPLGASPRSSTAKDTDLRHRPGAQSAEQGRAQAHLQPAALPRQQLARASRGPHREAGRPTLTRGVAISPPTSLPPAASYEMGTKLPKSQSLF